MKKFYLAIFILMVLFSVAGCAPEYESIENSLPTITVQGMGKVITVPDEAVASFGVRSEEKLLQRAYNKNTESMNRVINVVKSLGIDPKDIKTSSYSVTPIYPRDDKGRIIPGKPVSYRVSQNLTVKIRDLSKVGDVIDKTIGAGTNVFNSLQFRSSKIEDLKKEAKIEAAKDAKEKASLLAKSLGVKVGRVLKVTESTVQPYPARNLMAFEAGAAKAAPQIEAGSMEVTATAGVIYEIVQ